MKPYTSLLTFILLLASIAPFSLCAAQTIKIGDTYKSVTLTHAAKAISLNFQHQGKHKETIWSKPITYRPNSNELNFTTSVYPTVINPKINPYVDAKIITADYKDLGNDSSICLVLIELEYKRNILPNKWWIGPKIPRRYGRGSLSRFDDLFVKNNYLLRSFIKNNGAWKPYLSCYLNSIWYDLIGVPVKQVSIQSKNNYAVSYEHGRKLVKYNQGEEYAITRDPGPDYETSREDGKLKRYKILMDTKKPITRELIYDAKVEFLQVKDSGVLKYAVKALWWKGFDEFVISHINDFNYFKIGKTQKSRLPDTAIKYEPPLITIANEYTNTLFDIVKFTKEGQGKPFTKNEIIRLADTRYKDKNDPNYKKDIQISLASPHSSPLYFYEE